MQGIFVVVVVVVVVVFCVHQRHKPVKGGGYNERFVFALLLCNFLHPKQIFVVFCSHEELSRLVLAISLRISALLCQPSLTSSVAAN